MKETTIKESHMVKALIYGQMEIFTRESFLRVCVMVKVYGRQLMGRRDTRVHSYRTRRKVKANTTGPTEINSQENSRMTKDTEMEFWFCPITRS